MMVHRLLEKQSMARLFGVFQGKRHKSKNRSILSVRLAVEQLEDRLTPALTNQGGPILPNVQVQAVYLGSDWVNNSTLNAQTTQFDAFLQTTVNSSYMDMLNIF